MIEVEKMNDEQSAPSDKVKNQNSLAKSHDGEAHEMNAEIGGDENMLNVKYTPEHEHEVPDEPEPDHRSEANIENEMTGQLEENSVSSTSLTKVTASVAPLKQDTDPSHTCAAEKFEQNKRDKTASGVPDIFKLSAGEARIRLVSRKKDPRRDIQMSLQEKYRLVSNM